MLAVLAWWDANREGVLGVPVVLPGVSSLVSSVCVRPLLWLGTRILFSSGPGQVIKMLTCVVQVHIRFALTSLLSDDMLTHKSDSRHVI